MAERRHTGDLGSGMASVRIPVAGGPPVRLTLLDAGRGESYHVGPVALPDGRHFLYLRGSRYPNIAGLYVGDMDESPAKQTTTRVMPVATGVAYAADEGETTGHWLTRKTAQSWPSGLIRGSSPS